MREVLRRRVMEAAPGENWVDTDLNEILNDALVQAQKDVMVLVPDAFVNIAQQNLTASLEFYARPAGIWYELFVQVLNATTGRYEDIEQRDYVDGRQKVSSDSTTTYALLGRHFAIHPIPSATVVNGLQTIFVPTLSMSDDADVPELHLGLHMLVVLWAHRMLVGETGEQVGEIKDLIDEYRAAIPTYYRRSGAPEVIRPTTIKDYFNP
jgi:hypothetical protein